MISTEVILSSQILSKIDGTIFHSVVKTALYTFRLTFCRKIYSLKNINFTIEFKKLEEIFWAGRSNLLTTFPEKLQRKLTVWKKTLWLISDFEQRKFSTLTKFSARFRSCSIPIQRSFLEEIVSKKYIAYYLFPHIQQKYRAFGGNFCYDCQKSTLWIQRNIFRDSLLL